MKERGITFNSEMVLALLSGTKTQTRRTVRIRPGYKIFDDDEQPWPLWTPRAAELNSRDDNEQPCPYGSCGDRLWVREAWRTAESLDAAAPRELEHGVGISYEATQGERTPTGRYRHAQSTGRYRHARFMPRWASRFTLELTDVRVQRVAGISEEDARAEGVEPLTWGADVAGGLGHTAAYGRLWDEINGRGAWYANPWVWALTFEVDT